MLAEVSRVGRDSFVVQLYGGGDLETCSEESQRETTASSEQVKYARSYAGAYPFKLHAERIDHEAIFLCVAGRRGQACRCHLAVLRLISRHCSASPRRQTRC